MKKVHVTESKKAIVVPTLALMLVGFAMSAQAAAKPLAEEQAFRSVPLHQQIRGDQYRVPSGGGGTGASMMPAQPARQVPLHWRIRAPQLRGPDATATTSVRSERSTGARTLPLHIRLRSKR